MDAQWYHYSQLQSSPQTNLHLYNIVQTRYNSALTKRHNLENNTYKQQRAIAQLKASIKLMWKQSLVKIAMIHITDM